MQALIDFLMRNLLQLWPIARVYSWEQGMRVRRGIMAGELAPGLHWRWWFIDQVWKEQISEQGLDLATASITTSDGTSVSISGNVAYRVTSMTQMWGAIWNVRTTLALGAIGEIATHCSQRSWHDLTANRLSIEAELVAALMARYAGCGVSIERVNLTDLVVTRGHRHYLDGMGRPT